MAAVVPLECWLTIWFAFEHFPGKCSSSAWKSCCFPMVSLYGWWDSLGICLYPCELVLICLQEHPVEGRETGQLTQLRGFFLWWFRDTGFLVTLWAWDPNLVPCYSFLHLELWTFPPYWFRGKLPLPSWNSLSLSGQGSLTSASPPASLPLANALTPPGFFSWQLPMAVGPPCWIFRDFRGQQCPLSAAASTSCLPDVLSAGYGYLKPCLYIM